MATKIVTKNSSTAGAAPTATDLVQGELAVNVADGRLYTEDNAAAIVELGVNPATEITANAGIALPDSQKATFGASDDLQIFHDGAASVIADVGVGHLIIGGENLYLKNTLLTETYIDCVANAGVYLRYDNGVKLNTTSTGINVTGVVAAGDGSVTAPSVRGTDVNTGLFFPSGGVTAITRNGVEGMRIDASGVTTFKGEVKISTAANKKLSFNDDGGTFRAGIQAVTTGGQMIASAAANDFAIRSQSNMLFSTGGNTERMRIDSSGNVLVGKSSTNYANAGAELKSDGKVYSTVSGGASLVLNRKTNDGDIISFYKDNAAVGSIGTFSGDLTIGDDDVGLRFDTGTGLIPWDLGANSTGGAATNGAIDIGAASARFKDLYLSGAAFANYVGSASDTNTNIAFDTADTIRFTNGATERMRIDASGRVGIGTSSFVNNNAKFVVSNGTVDIEHYTDSDIGYIGTRSNHPFGLLTNGTPKLYITTAGNVGIGGVPNSWSTVTNVLQMKDQTVLAEHAGTGYLSQNWYYNAGEKYIGNGYAVRQAISSVNGSWTVANASNNTSGAGAGISWQERVRIDASGNLLVGTDTSRAGLHSLSLEASNSLVLFRAANAQSLSQIIFVRNTNGSATTAGSINTTGTSTSYNTSSDYRLKEDDVAMTGATERVKALRPVNFAWKADGSRVDGFFAHELAEVVPEATTGTKDAMMDEEYEVTAAIEEVRDEDDNITTEAVEAVMGTRSVPDMQGIDQSKLVPLLTATIQELIARIEALENGE